MNPPSQHQHGILMKMLSVNTPDKSVLLDQAKDYTMSLVPYGDNYMSFDIHVSDNKKPFKSPNGVVSVGSVNDEDGASITVLLHVYDGYLSEVEIVRDDGKPMVAPVQASKIVVKSP